MLYVVSILNTNDAILLILLFFAIDLTPNNDLPVICSNAPQRIYVLCLAQSNIRLCGRRRTCLCSMPNRLLSTRGLRLGVRVWAHLRMRVRFQRSVGCRRW